MKFFQLVAGTRSCSAEEIVFYDSVRNAWLTGIPGLVYSCSGHMVTSGGDFQPVLPAQGVPSDNCNWQHIDSHRNYSNGTGTGTIGLPECHVMQDDTWHQIELEVRIDDGYRLWIDGVLVVSTSGIREPTGPYGQIYLSNYITGYDGDLMAGSGTFGDGLWRIYYDDLIVSTDCITSCQ
jgi:hypothetical protein